MLAFQYYNPVMVYFENGVHKKIGQHLMGKYKKILLVCAKGPFRDNGLFTEIKKQLQKTGASVFEMSDIDSNPKMYSVYEGIKIAKDNQIDCMVALGGGSAMDCTKLMAMSAKTGIDPYEYVWGNRPEVTESIDTVMIPTIAATGTELNNTAVIVDEKTKDKSWCITEFPRYCFMDPEITASLPKTLTIWGAMDILSHTFEYYFNGYTGSEFQLCFSEALLSATMTTLEKLVQNPKDIDARGEILWCSTMTWGTGLTKIGRKDADMTCHNIEERFSGYFDTHHGGCLGIITPRWMRLAMTREPAIFARFARKVMNIDCDNDKEAAALGVSAYIDWLKKIGAPQKYSDLSAEVVFSDEELLLVAEKIWKVCKGKIGKLTPMSFEDIKSILFAGKMELNSLDFVQNIRTGGVHQ
jgi:alcohol dehydrogenase YqhD (iron-dependent ADH family)